MNSLSDKVRFQRALARTHLTCAQRALLKAGAWSTRQDFWRLRKELVTVVIAARAALRATGTANKYACAKVRWRWR